MPRCHKNIKVDHFGYYLCQARKQFFYIWRDQVVNSHRYTFTRIMMMMSYFKIHIILYSAERLIALLDVQYN